MFFGLAAPSASGEVFAPGVVSLEGQREMGCTVSPDGKEFYFGRAVPGGPDWGIWVVRQEDGRLSEPELLSFSGVFRDYNPFMTPDGEHLIFYRESFGDSETREGSWIVDRAGGSWGEPRYLVFEYHVTSADLHTFYFNFVPGAEHNRAAPFAARELGSRTFQDGAFSESKRMEGDINSSAWDAHGCIAADGSFMVFDSARSGKRGDSDMYVSFRRANGTWSAARNLGRKINRRDGSMPALSADGKYIFFSYDGDIWWAPAGIIEQLRNELADE